MAQPASKPIIIVVGTRPEGIKMIPVYTALKKAGLPVLLCATMQHDQLLTHVFDLFGVVPDIDLRVMRVGQDLFYLTQSVLQKMKEVFAQINPSLVLVHGDTTSAMAAGLAAFYARIPIGHVEAGLRTDTIDEPFPEEMNRRFLSIISSYHFAPTANAAANLLVQGIDRSTVFCVGNTIVDALRLVHEKIEAGLIVVSSPILDRVNQCIARNQKIVLLTVHRRESFNGGIETILSVIKEYLLAHPESVCFYPYHPNPAVLAAIKKGGLSSIPNMVMTEPLMYADLVCILRAASCVLTDSGGIQEEAVSVGTPVIVLREKTERAEGIWVGAAYLAGLDRQTIRNSLEFVLSSTKKENSELQNVYGDGYAADRIAHVIQTAWRRLGDVYHDNVQGKLVNQWTSKGDSMKRVVVLGLGYIGLPTSIVAAEHGLMVVGFDIDKERVEKINAGDPVIKEPELFEKLQIVRQSGVFRATTIMEQADYFVIAVPTPHTADKKADLSYVFAAAQSIATVLEKGNTVILESTVSVGTTQKLADFLMEKTGWTCGQDFFVAHCPERVLPGNIFKELTNNTRLIGGVDKKSVHAAARLYKTFVQADLYLTDATTAEMIKLVENSSRDVQIAFAHQVAAMAESVGLDPYEVIELANKHPRVNILSPTCGVGGHCIAVDPWFLIESFPHLSQLLTTARIVNDARPINTLGRIRAAIAQWRETHTGMCTIALLGATYKPNVDDLRASPALQIIQSIIQHDDVRTLVCEPHVKPDLLPGVPAHTVVSLDRAIDEADIVVFLVAHTRFSVIDSLLLAQKKVLDFCGLLHRPIEKGAAQEYMFWPAQRPEHFSQVSSPEIVGKTNKTMMNKEGCS